MPWTHGHFHWNELMTWDVEKAKRFYADSIGWTYDSMEVLDGTYWVARQGEVPVGGLFELKSPEFDGIRENWVPYLAVDDVDARVEKAVALGAVLQRPIFDIPGVGRIAMLRQPANGQSDTLQPGAGLGWMTPAQG